MSTNEDLHHKREQNGDEELTSMLQRYLDNSCSNISGSMGKNKAIETGTGGPLLMWFFETLVKQPCKHKTM